MAEGGPDEVRCREILARVGNGAGRTFRSLAVTRNRRVMASVGKGGAELRLHAAFLDAPEEIHRALGKALVKRGNSRGDATRTIREWLGSQEDLPASRPARRTPGPRRYLDRLQAEFDRVNAQYFGDQLPRVQLRTSTRMRRRNGHFSSEPLEIAISAHLCEKGVAGEAEMTLRHEMIHLWQYVEGRKPGHRSDFRRWAVRLEIPPRSQRPVEWC